MAKIRPLKSEDLGQTEGVVEEPLSKRKAGSSATVVSEDLFGSTSQNKSSRYENTEIYHKRAYINLAMPVLNFFLAGSGAQILSKILRVDAYEIAIGREFYDLQRKESFTMSKCSSDMVFDRSRYLIGGDYLRYLIKNLDIETELTNRVKMYVMKAAKSDKVCKKMFNDGVDVDDMFYVTRKQGQMHVVDDYYVSFKCELGDENAFKEKLMGLVQEDLSSYNCRTTLLLALRSDKSAILDQVMDFVEVTPIGYRPSFGNRFDKITKAYDQIVRVNEELRGLIANKSSSFEIVRTHYIDLVNTVINLTVMGTDKYDEQYKPLAEVLKSKKGFIRDKMQGTRIDYSGRGVIIVDPTMSVTDIGIPRSMAEKLMELKELQMYKTNASNKAELFHPDKKPLKASLGAKALEGKYIIAGRQPTLYLLGLRGFRVRIVEGNAIVMNPLCTPAFNADFDGDQMHIEVLISDEAEYEAEQLMGVMSNLFLPRSGDCHIAPRQEIIHGLWKASSVKAEDFKGSKTLHVDDNKESKKIFLSSVCEQRINIYDTVIVGSNPPETAGKAAIRVCLGPKYGSVRLGVTPITWDKSKKEKPVTEGFYKELDKLIAIEDKDQFASIIDNTVRLGFAITNIFPPSISVLNHPDVSHLIAEFDEAIKEHEKYYNMGLETDEAFTAFYDSKYAQLEQDIKKELKGNMNQNNGYMEMVNSGARGNMSNIMQMFGMKGRVMKNDVEAFNAIIKHPLVGQLTGLEHMITAYGGREGLIDKSIQTYAPGYLSRKMCHTTNGISNVVEDCGTNDGILLDFNFIKQFINPSMLTGEDVADNMYVRDYVVKLLKGRYIVGRDEIIKTDEDAIQVYEQYVAKIKSDTEIEIKAGVKMRSPITCKKPCCVKCYGIDMCTNTLAVPGTPVGFIASGAIGEPGTQLTMKNFQNGGVAGVTNLTSSFDTMNNYTHLYDLRNTSAPLSYDFISPCEGYIETKSMGDGTKELQIIQYDDHGKRHNKLANTRIRLYEDIELKDHVEKGESIQKVQGDLNVREVEKYRGAEEAQRYLAVKLYDIFQKEVYVNIKHFEVLVAGMTFRVCTKGNSYFKTGLFYTVGEYWGHDRTGAEFFTLLKGVGDVPLYRNDVYSTIFMEDIKKGIGRSIIVSGQDEMKLPITRYSFGLNLGIGSCVPGYVESRGKVNV